MRHRVWTGKEMDYGFHLNSKGQLCAWNHGGCYEIEDMEGIYVMRSTCILDRKGNEIYESDILLWQKSQGTTKVICRWDYYALNQYVMYSNFIEIIGNIHENPGLEINR